MPLGAVIVLAALGGGAVWWYHTSRPDYRFARGREAIQRQEWDTVQAITDKLEAAGETDRARLLRGEALTHQNYFAQALEALNGIQDRGALRLQAALLSGRCLLELRQLREAHGVYAWLLEQQPDQIDAVRGLAAVAYDLGQLPQAVEHLETVARLAPEDGRPYRLIGLIHKDLSRFAEAEAAYREALRRDLPAGARRAVRGELVAVLLKRHRFAEALAVLGDLRDDPQAGEVAARAEALLGLGRRDEARTLLGPALGRHPGNPHLLRLRGELHLKAGQPRRAVQRLEQAVRQLPRDEICRYQLALAYTAAGQPKKAAEQQRQLEAIRAELKSLTELSKEAMKRPWDAAVRSQLAELCEKMDDPRLAAMWREAARACRQPGASSFGN